MHAAMLTEQLWEPPPVDLVLPDDEVHVWQVVLDLPASSVRRLHRVLAANEIDRAGRIQGAGSRNRFIAAHGLLREILCRYLDAEPDQLRFCYGPCGKPSLAAPPGAGELTFNLAHSHGLALCAVARGRELGVDLERIRRESGWERMARHYLSASERATLGALPAHMRCAAFFKYWTCKEAYVKAIGAGQSQSFSQVTVGLRADGAAVLCVDGGMGWSVQVLALDRGYAAALVVEGHGWRLRCWQWPAHMDGY